MFIVGKAVSPATLRNASNAELDFIGAHKNVSFAGLAVKVVAHRKNVRNVILIIF